MKNIGDKIGKYEITNNNPNRRGGNGNVYFVKYNQKNYALKYVVFDSEMKYKRFQREIEIMKKIKNKVTGIMKIYDSYISEKYEENKSFGWYVMDIAKTLNINEIKKYHITKIIKNVLEIAKILKQLHRKKISHRDIKPENILCIDNKWYLSDFGLVDYPNAENITIDEKNRALGPRMTIAPEFKRNPDTSEGTKADIYSLAKTLWIFLTGDKNCFDGQYNFRDKKISIRNYIKNKPLGLIEQLLFRATENSPENRIDIDEVIEYLENFLNYKMEDKINYEWKFILENLFFDGIPNVVIWKNSKQIINILNKFSYFNSMNHMFFGAGGLDLDYVKNSNEEGFIELISGGLIYKIKPKSLTFYSFENSEWNYLWLESEEIKLSNKGMRYEEVVEICPGNYLPNWMWYYQRNMFSVEKRKFSKKARLIKLYSKSNFVIFSKFSQYNKEGTTYNGYENIFNREEFNEIILKCSKSSKNNLKMLDKIYRFLKAKNIKKEDMSSKILCYFKNLEFFLYEIQILTNHKIINMSEDEKKKFLYECIKRPELIFEKEKKEISEEEKLKLITKDIEKIEKVLSYIKEEENLKIEYELKIIIENIDFYIDERNKLNKSNNTMIFDTINDNINFGSCFTKKRKFNKNQILEIKKEILSLGIKNLDLRIKTFLLNNIKIPTKVELDEVLKKGNSFKDNALVLDENGKLELLSIENNEFEISLYPIVIKGFIAYKNSVGEYYNEDNKLDYYYEQLINKIEQQNKREKNL
jgi:non-specific serine/threonine protein kinase